MTALASTHARAREGTSDEAARLDAALRFLRRRALPAGRTSTLRKVNRAHRIGLGDRPLVKPWAVSRDGSVLHPTKGWRRA